MDESQQKYPIFTPLLHTIGHCQMGTQPQLMELLLEHPGVDVNLAMAPVWHEDLGEANPTGKTPLEALVWRVAEDGADFGDAVSALCLHEKLDPELITHTRSALLDVMLMSKYGDKEEVLLPMRVLLEDRVGAERMAKYRAYISYVENRASNAEATIAALLEMGDLINARDIRKENGQLFEGDTPLRWALRKFKDGRSSDDGGVLQIMLTLPLLDVSVRTGLGGKSAILKACENNIPVDILKALLNHPSCRDVHEGPSSFTPLMGAVHFSKRAEMVKVRFYPPTSSSPPFFFFLFFCFLFFIFFPLYCFPPCPPIFPSPFISPFSCFKPLPPHAVHSGPAGVWQGLRREPADGSPRPHGPLAGH